jgi:hypothetical protein
MGHENPAIMTGLVALPPTHPKRVSYTRELCWMLCNYIRGREKATSRCDPLVLDFIVSRTVRNTFIFIYHAVYSIQLKRQKMD